MINCLTQFLHGKDDWTILAYVCGFYSVCLVGAILLFPKDKRELNLLALFPVAPVALLGMILYRLAHLGINEHNSDNNTFQALIKEQQIPRLPEQKSILLIEQQLRLPKNSNK